MRLCLECGTDDALVASMLPRDGLLLASLTESDGLVERPDATTTVASNDMLTAYPHALFWSP